jgi:Holliday junction resolvase RusA-like endonuclease
VNEKKLVITVPMLPPSVNHYVEHKGLGVHVKSAAAKAWERDWPIWGRQRSIVGKRFAVTIAYRFGPRDHFDVDNLNKCVLDCVAKSGMLRDAKDKALSDSHVKCLHVEIFDRPEHRELGPQTEITIDAME